MMVVKSNPTGAELPQEGSAARPAAAGAHPTGAPASAALLAPAWNFRGQESVLSNTEGSLQVL